MMKTITYVSLLLYAFIGTFQAFSQEMLIGIEVNQSVKDLSRQIPRLKSTATGFVELPFFDDFSGTYIFPDEANWSDRDAFINKDYPVNPISASVATLDAIDHTGAMYENASTWPFYADRLTSWPVDMEYLPGDSLYLSFFYQPQGKGNNPQSHDSLRLEFYSPDTESWRVVWSVPGDTLSEFRLVMIPVTGPEYLKKGFRFRFSNIASITDNRYNRGAMSNGDHWHIDYVYLDAGRTIADTVFSDVAFTSPLKSVLNNYVSMPWDHFLSGRLAEMGSVLPMSYRNNGISAASVIRRYNIFNVYDNENAHSFSGGSSTTGPRETMEYNPDLAYSFSTTGNDSALFRITAWLETGTSDYKGNDTITYDQKFSNYFALDDGTSENGYGLFGGGTENAGLAFRFNAYKPDSLRAIQIYFNQSLDNASVNYFKLAVWEDDNGKPGRLVYSQEGARPVYEDEVNGFHTFHLDTARFVSGVFYAGIIQTTSEFLNIGFDINTNNQNSIFYNINGDWLNSSFEGSLMIRPVVGYPLTAEHGQARTEKNNLKVYPNPAANVLYIDLEPEIDRRTITYNLFNRSGQLVYQGTGEINSIDLRSLPPGIYFLQAESEYTKFETRKILISH